MEKMMIEFDAIKEATENFDPKYHIGTGGYGSVYKAELEHFDSSMTEGNNELEMPKKCSTVAIKCILNRDDKQGEEGFFAEIETLGSCRHDNIVSLLGFCHKPPHMILVYEHISKGSLDEYLSKKRNMTNLTWVQRINICLDIARGLDYMHTPVDYKRRIIHRDIKSANILLTEKWEAKIADFGLSVLHPLNHVASTIQASRIAGTGVYLDPEYERSGEFKKESDVYSFGVVLFEILTGRLASDSVYTSKSAKGLAPLVRKQFKKQTLEKMVDPNLKEESDEKAFELSKGIDKESLHTFFKIGHQCLAETQAARPTMKEVITELEKTLYLQEHRKDGVRLAFEAIKLATQDFSVKIGHKHGSVYKGNMSRVNGPTPIVVKRWAASNSDQEKQKFLTELGTLFEYKHENIISLIGYCDENDQKLSVYEHASYGSLDKHVDSTSLTWTQRLKISIDVATGLDFLHGGGSKQAPVMLHRDINSSNILLKGDWKAKIRDFGLCMMDFEVDDSFGTLGYVDPQYGEFGYLTSESDIYSFGVVLLEMLCGRIQHPHKDLVQFFKDHFEEARVDICVFQGIKDTIVQKSLNAFQKIAYGCLQDERGHRPIASKVVLELKEALEFQEDIEIWAPRLPRDYKEIIHIADSPEKYTSVPNKDLYDMFSNKGIFLGKEKVCLSISSDREIDEMVSASMFSYENHRLHKWRSIKKSRFKKVVKIVDISNLRIQINIKTQFLSPNVIYGAYLVFRFCNPRKTLSKLMYVNLKYQMGDKTRHAYFATCGDDEWMMIELCRFMPYKKDVDFKVLLESLSRYYCGNSAIYVEGIHFQVINDASLKVKPEVYENPEGVQGVDYDEIAQLEDYGGKLFSPRKANEKKCHMLPAKMVLYESSKVKCFNWKSLADQSRFLEVAELLSHQVFRIKCKFKMEKLSPDTDYACYLVFKLSQKCHGLWCPVKVRDVRLRRNKESKFLYFRSPSVVNLHTIERVPRHREDGSMEVVVWEFNSGSERIDDYLRMSLKLRCYEGTMYGLIVYGIEFRPI